MKGGLTKFFDSKVRERILAPAFSIFTPEFAIFASAIFFLSPAVFVLNRGYSAFAQDGSAPEKPEPKATLSRAGELLLEGQYEDAIRVYEEVAKSEGQRLEAELGNARARIHLGQYSQVADLLRKLDAQESRSWHYETARIAWILGRYEEAIDHAREAIKIDPHFCAGRLLLAQLLEMLGRTDEAIEAYHWFDRQLVEKPELPRDAEWITNAAIGFMRYSVLTRTKVATRTQHVMHEMLEKVYSRIDRTYWPARIAAGDLLRERFNNDTRTGSVADYTAALKVNGRSPEAFVGLGEVLLEHWNFEEVERSANQALEINPNFPPAHHLLARKWVTERRYLEAIETCSRALTINSRDVTALSISAAASACRYDEQSVEEMARRVTAINPRCALFHRTLGDALSGIRQYAASEREYLKAIEFEPTDANARTELGMMYMQWGLERKARDALDAAWALDPFNLRTKNTLELLDSLDKFARHETPHFMIRFDASKDPGLGEFVGNYLEDLYGLITADYGTPLDEKTIIEFFPTHAAFGVRITGKPWIHTIGACTGRVIALTTPRRSAGSMGPYNFARVLRHEFTHTVTLAATQNRIPHWFTEGLAVYQEETPRSFAWCEMLVEALRRNQLFTLESIDWGFMRPSRPTDRQMAYAQSEWMCEYIVERFGFDAIQGMLKQYHAGKTQVEVFRSQLGMELDSFHHDFVAWASQQAKAWEWDLTPAEDPAELSARVEAEPNNAGLFGRLAKALVDADEFELALSAARRAVELDPTEKNGLTVLGRMLNAFAEGENTEAGRRQYEDEALPLLESLMKIDPKSWTAPKCLGSIHLRRKDVDRAVEAFKRLQTLCPMDPSTWRALGGIYVTRGDDEAALPQLLELARLDEDDPGIVREIGRIYRKRGKMKEALHWYKQALFIDPFNVDLQTDTGDISMQSGDSQAALQSYRMLTKLEPEKSEHFEKAALAAHKLGELAESKKLAAEAVRLNPESAAASLLR